MDAWHFGSWNETLHYGVGEAKAIALAMAIILAIAFFRYVVRPWWLFRYAAPPRGDAGQGPGVPRKG